MRRCKVSRRRRLRLTREPCSQNNKLTLPDLHHQWHARTRRWTSLTPCIDSSSTSSWLFAPPREQDSRWRQAGGGALHSSPPGRDGTSTTPHHTARQVDPDLPPSSRAPAMANTAPCKPRTDKMHRISPPGASCLEALERLKLKSLLASPNKAIRQQCICHNPMHSQLTMSQASTHLSLNAATTTATSGAQLTWQTLTAC